MRDWVAALDAGRRGDRRYSLVWQTIGGRQIGRNRLPVRAVVSSVQQAWALLGTAAAVRRFDALLDLAQGHPAVRRWIVENPHRAIALEPVMPQVIAAYGGSTPTAARSAICARSARPASTPNSPSGTGRYWPRCWGAVALPGVPGRPGPAEQADADPAASGAVPGPARTVDRNRREGRRMAKLALAPRFAVIVENETTHLSVEVPDDGVVIWGRGFDVDAAGRLPWLADADVLYWGDIDTHGFAILDRLRARLPQARSVLMDRETLLAHRDRWVGEDRPTAAVLARLNPDERDLYAELVSDALGEGCGWNRSASTGSGPGNGCRGPEPARKNESGPAHFARSALVVSKLFGKPLNPRPGMSFRRLPR